MDQENKITASIDPIDMTVTVIYKIRSFEALANDIVEAVKLLSDLPNDLASRRFANEVCMGILSKVAAKHNTADNTDNDDSDKTVKEKLADGEPVNVNELEN